MGRLGEGGREEDDGNVAGGIKLKLSDALKAITKGDASSATELFLNDRDASSVASLKSFENLKKLELRGNKLSTLSFLRLNHALCWLAVSNNCLHSLSHLDSLSSLAVLDISDNRVESLAGLTGLIGLKALIAARNQIKEVDGLTQKSNPALETLVLSHNLIEECSFRGFKCLKKLSVGHNKLNNFPGLEKLPALAELRLNGNSIASVGAAVASLDSLTILDIGNNSIAEVKDMEPLTGLPALKSLTVAGNPCFGGMVDEPSIGLAALLESLPKLEILNNRRRDGSQSAKKKHGTSNADAPGGSFDGKSRGKGKGKEGKGKGKEGISERKDDKGKGKRGKGKGKGGKGMGKGKAGKEKGKGYKGGKGKEGKCKDGKGKRVSKVGQWKHYAGEQGELGTSSWESGQEEGQQYVDNREKNGKWWRTNKLEGEEPIAEGEKVKRKKMLKNRETRTKPGDSAEVPTKKKRKLRDAGENTEGVREGAAKKAKKQRSAIGADVEGSKGKMRKKRRAVSSAE